MPQQPVHERQHAQLHCHVGYISSRDGATYYTCHCLAGFTGLICETDIDECHSDPCQNGGACLDEVDAYFCNCLYTYYGDECQGRFEPCDFHSCLNGGNCTELTDTTYQCDCEAEWVGDYCEFDNTEPTVTAGGPSTLAPVTEGALGANTDDDDDDIIGPITILVLVGVFILVVVCFGALCYALQKRKELQAEFGDD